MTNLPRARLDRGPHRALSSRRRSQHSPPPRHLLARRPLPANLLAIPSQRASPDQPPPSQPARHPLPASAAPPSELSGRRPLPVTCSRVVWTGGDAAAARFCGEQPGAGQGPMVSLDREGGNQPVVRGKLILLQFTSWIRSMLACWERRPPGEARLDFLSKSVGVNWPFKQEFK